MDGIDGRLTSETMAAGGAWLGDRTTVATLNPDSRSVMRMAVDGAGAALAGWTTTVFEPPYPSSLDGSAKAAGGSWATPVTFLSGADSFGTAPTTAIAADGTGLASWIESIPVPGSNEEEWVDTPYAAVVAAPPAVVVAAPPAARAPSVISSPSGAPGAPPIPRRLGPVYGQVQHHRLWLSLHGRTVTVSHPVFDGDFDARVCLAEGESRSWHDARKYPRELLDRGARLVFESGRPVAHVAS